MYATRLSIALAMLLLGACSKDAVQPPAASAVPSGVSLHFSAAEGLNPGASGTPAPVRVRIYELKNSAAFDRADYFALTERPQATLGPDLNDHDEVLLQPGARLHVQRRLDPATRQVGVVVGYREIDLAQWRTLLPVPPHDYQISLDVRAVRSAVATPPPVPAR